MRAFLPILALLLVLGQANPPRGVTSAYRISGVVVDAVTNAPVARAQVSISLGNDQISTVAGDDGRFAFEGLEAGKYVLNAAAPGYVHEGYKQHGAFLVAIATGNSQDSERLVFRLHPQAVIYGRVTDEYGEAVRGAQVALFASDLARGSRARFVRTMTQTNDLGEYRFAHLLPGKYYLAVQAQPWYARSRLSTQTTQNADFAASGQLSLFVSGSGVDSVDSGPILDVVYPVTFYPGVTDESSAAELVLNAGEKEEANITLQAIPATHLRLTHIRNEEETSFNVGASQRVFGTFNFGPNTVMGQVSPDEYEVAGLPPGGLTFVITTNKGKEWTSRTVEADASSGGTIDASGLPATARVSGRILLPGGGAETTAGNVNLMSTTPTALPTATTPLQKDGTFHFPEVQPGTYRIQVNLPSGNDYVQKVSAKGAEASGRKITIAGGGDVDLSVTLGQGRSQVTGVVNIDGKPAAGVMILLVPESGLEMEEDSRMDESDSDGTFSLAGILPGGYVLLAINDGWDLEWTRPDALRPYLSGGKKMSIDVNQSIRVTVSAQERTAATEKKSQ